MGEVIHHHPDDGYGEMRVPVEAPEAQHVGVFCLVHGEMGCPLPDCWRCGNHDLGPSGRCSDPRCRASNDETARAIVAAVRHRWRKAQGGEPPVELVAYEIGRVLSRVGRVGFPTHEEGAETLAGSVPSPSER